MKSGEKVLVCLGAFLFSAIGYLLILFISENIDVTSTEGILQGARIINLVEALLWAVVCLVAAFGATLWVDPDERVGMISILFILLWIVCDFGILLGIILDMLIDGQSVSISADFILDNFFANLQIALSPALASCLGISIKR